MGKFDSGVKGYVTGKATVYVHFPISWKGERDISCKQCKFFRVTSRSCALNDAVCAYPEKYVGDECPLDELVVDLDEEFEKQKVGEEADDGI